jgi:LPS sulfotransferase NodH
MLKERIPFRMKYLARELARLTVGTTADLLMPQTTRFVILTNGRTGSNLLVDYLQQNPRIRLYGEIFGTYYLGQPIVTEMIRRQGSAAFLDRMLQRTLTESHVGAKILYAQIEGPYGDNRGLPGLRDAGNALTQNRDIKIIHLKRDNLLDVVVSMALAKKTKSYVGRDYGDTTVAIDPDKCGALLETLRSQEEKYRAQFAEHTYLEVTYEDLVANPDAVIADSFQFLNVAPVPVQSRLRKQNHAPHQRVISNYRDLKTAFQGSRYERYFA